MIKAIIIDDEYKSRKVLEKEIIRTELAIDICEICGSAMEGIAAIELHNPDIIFLDIEMPAMNGFEMLKRLPNLESSVIFTTAYDQFAIDAFKYSAIDYLLKPISSKDLITAIEKHKKLQYRNQKPLDNIEFLLGYLEKRNNRKIVLNTGNGLEVIGLDEIIYCEADSNYTIFHMLSKKIIVSRTLKEYDEMLSKKNFLRVHQTYLVNIDYIKIYNRKESYLKTLNNKDIPVSKSRRESVAQSLLRINE